MRRVVSVLAISLGLGVLCSPARAGEVAIYTGNVGWIDKASADAQAQICVDALNGVGITNTWYPNAADDAAVATWLTSKTNNGDLDVLILYGYVPTSIYAAANTQPDGSLVELFIESTDGDMVINHADYMFYVTNPCCNGDAAVRFIMDNPVMGMWDDNTGVAVTVDGTAISPSHAAAGIGDSDRPLHTNELGGDWYVEVALSQNGAGTRADPVVVRDGNRGRLAVVYQNPDLPLAPRGAVDAEIITYLTERVESQLTLTGPATTVAGTPVRYTVQLRDDLAILTSSPTDVTVNLASDSVTGAFDTTRKGSFGGTVTSVTIPAGEVSATFYYKDTTAGPANLQLTATGLAAAGLTVNVVEAVESEPGDVAIYTGNTGWISKELADAQAQICVDRLNLLGITNQWFALDTDVDAVASWVSERTGDGRQDVLITYGFFPRTLYECANISPDGSVGEMFIESTDGDAFMNHADYMFYVSNDAALAACYNGDAGLVNMMDTPVYMWDDFLVSATQDGRDIAPSLAEYQGLANNGLFYWANRPLHLNELAGEWFAEVVLAENASGTRVEPVIVRDGNRGRLIPVLQAPDRVDPKGAVATEIIAWLHGINLGDPVKLGLLGQTSVTVGQTLKLTVQVQSFLGSPVPVTAATTITLQSSAGTGRFDTSLGGSFDGSVTSVTIAEGESSAVFYYKDTSAGTPTVTASRAGLTSAAQPVNVRARTFAPAGEVAVYTGATWWITKARADQQALICQTRLDTVGVSTEIFDTVDQTAALKTWVDGHRNNGKLDVLVLFGTFPGSIYPTGNTQPNFSSAERFIESTDGDAIINCGDWMFYVDYTQDHVDTTRVENAAAGLQNMMDLPAITMAGGDNPMVVTAEAASIAPSLTNYLTDRPLHTADLGGNWAVEAVLAQDATGTLADPVIVRNGDQGRLIPVFQADSQNDPQGAVISEIVAWLMQKAFVASEIGIAGADEILADMALELTVSLQDEGGVKFPTQTPIVVSLTKTSATGAFDTAEDGPFNGTVTSVTIPAGQASATIYYKDSTAGLVTLSASAGGLTTGQIQVDVLEDVAVSQGEVVVYTGGVGWMDKAVADAQAQICVDALTTAGITATLVSTTADDATVADWMSAATGNGQLDVLVLYGYVPSSIYPELNAMVDGSISELFIESTDGDVILNHADWMFYVSSQINGQAGLESLMDLTGVNLGADNTPMIVTTQGSEIAPSLGDFLTDRPFPFAALAGGWFVEASLAEDTAGLRADPVILRDANRGRVVISHGTMLQDDPKGAVAAEIISWLMAKATGGGGPVFLRGDSNADGTLNITDGIFVLNYLFLGGPEPPCQEAANANDDASLNITDGIYILNYLFLGGPQPASPGPDTCGEDPAGSPSALGCVTYTHC